VNQELVQVVRCQDQRWVLVDKGLFVHNPTSCLAGCRQRLVTLFQHYANLVHNLRQAIVVSHVRSCVGQ
jgi:hypothetical protein